MQIETWNISAESYLRTCADSTAAQYRRALDGFAAWYAHTYGEQPDPALLTDEEAREWRGYLSVVGKLAASTVNVRLSALKGLARHVGGRIETKGIRRVSQPIEALTARELGRLVRVLKNHRWGPEWLSLRNVALIAVMARAGLRISETVALDVGNVQLNTRSGWATVRLGKGLKERRVPLSPLARKALGAYLKVRPEASAPALFLTKNWQRVSVRSVQQMIESAAQRAGIEQTVTPHILRHTFATRFLEKGGDLATLRDILGHANIATTSRYLHSNAAKMQGMVEEL